MKAVAALLFLALGLATVNSLGQCGGDCTTSAKCANEAGDLLCRCQNLVCTMVEDSCGGGCVTDGQCQDWAGGDESCVCSWLSCGRKDLVEAVNDSDRLLYLVNNIKTQKGRAEAEKAAV